MREVQDTEATADLSELLAAVEQGETIVITRDGKPVAHLIPTPKPVPEPDWYSPEARKMAAEIIEKRQAIKDKLRAAGTAKVTIAEILAWRNRDPQ